MKNPYTHTQHRSILMWQIVLLLGLCNNVINSVIMYIKVIALRKDENEPVLWSQTKTLFIFLSQDTLRIQTLEFKNVSEKGFSCELKQILIHKTVIIHTFASNPKISHSSFPTLFPKWKTFFFVNALPKHCRGINPLHKKTDDS